jgi:methionyl-tRNA synthetase
MRHSNYNTISEPRENMQSHMRHATVQTVFYFTGINKDNLHYHAVGWDADIN